MNLIIFKYSRQVWSQIYSPLNKDIIARFESRGVNDSEVVEFLKKSLISDTSKFILFSQGKILINATKSDINYLDCQSLSLLKLNLLEGISKDKLVLLGQHNNEDYFAVGISTLNSEDILKILKLTGPSFINPRNVLVNGLPMSSAAVAIIGQASARISYLHENKFAPTSGLPLESICAGHRLKAGTETVYPSTKPVTICLVVSKNGDKILLAERITMKGTGFFSCVAGFIHQAESVEDAAIREIFEETGVVVDPDSILILGSQPWPIGTGGGCELMLGCVAKATSEAISCDTNEIYRANWFSKPEVVRMLKNSKDPDFKRRFAETLSSREKTFIEEDSKQFQVPAEYAIAHHLIKSWIDIPE